MNYQRTDLVGYFFLEEEKKHLRHLSETIFFLLLIKQNKKHSFMTYLGQIANNLKSIPKIF